MDVTYIWPPWLSESYFPRLESTLQDAVSVALKLEGQSLIDRGLAWFGEPWTLKSFRRHLVSFIRDSPYKIY